MTVVLAVRCEDGIVIGADTQITDRDRGMSYPAQKLHRIGDRAAWGGSGARAVLLEIDEVLSAEADSVLEAENVGRALQERTIPVLRHHYDAFIENVPGDEASGGPAAYLLAAGYSGSSPWIIEVDPNGMINHYEDIGFHAIGSGAAMAHQAGALLAHFRMSRRSSDYGVVAVVRVLEALAITSPSVGGEFDVHRVTPDGARELDEDEMEQAHQHVRRWTDLEEEALDRLFE